MITKNNDFLRTLKFNAVSSYFIIRVCLQLYQQMKNEIRIFRKKVSQQKSGELYFQQSAFMVNDEEVNGKISEKIYS